MALGHGGGTELSRNGGTRRKGISGTTSVSGISWRKRHAGLLDDDGSPAGRIASGVDRDGKHLSALRPNSKPLPQAAYGRRFRAGELPERNHLATNKRPQ